MMKYHEIEDYVNIFIVFSGNDQRNGINSLKSENRHGK